LVGQHVGIVGAVLTAARRDEQELAKRLRRLPGCTIARSTSGSATTLSLGGVEVRSQGGLTAACRDWIAMLQTSALKKPLATG
jgi:hypothetical protein